MLHDWNQALQSKSFKKKFFYSFLILFLLLYFLAWFLSYIEERQGHVFYDPVLNFFKPQDVSNFIFITTYSFSLFGIVYAISNPFNTIHLCQMYILLTVFRIITLFFIPLNPPPEIIPLKDSFLENTFYNEEGNVKDLFFSGHTATLFLFFFFIKQPILKWVFFTAAISVAIAVLMQHIHYSYDVVVAPLFSYLSYWIIVKKVKFYDSKKSTNLE